MTIQELATIEKVDLRDIWPKEDKDFTPWLAKNLDELGKVLRMELELTRTEALVGDSNLALDILALETSTNNVVAIENQIDRADHTHIGQLLTYAAGHKANIVIWTATDFRDEYKTALDWLNEHTDDSLEFYGVEIGVIRIGGSAPAPLFQPVVVPNTWANRSKRSERVNDSPRAHQYRQFWRPLLERLNSEYGWSVKTNWGQSYYQAGTGFGTIGRIMRFTRQGEARGEISIQSSEVDWNKSVFDLLVESRDDIESALGSELEWERLEDRKACRIGVSRKGSIDDPEEELDQIRVWMINHLQKFRPVFHPHLKTAVEIASDQIAEMAG